LFFFGIYINFFLLLFKYSGLVGEIIKRFENKGFKLLGIKMLQADEELITKHYEEHIGKPFFPKIVKYILSGPVVGMVWQGKGVVAYGRVMLGKTDPLKSEPGTIRGDFGIDSGRNVVHGSDSVESAEREINLWFPEGVKDYPRALDNIIYEWLDGTPEEDKKEQTSEVPKTTEEESVQTTKTPTNDKKEESKPNKNSPPLTCCFFPLRMKNKPKKQ